VNSIRRIPHHIHLDEYGIIGVNIWMRLDEGRCKWMHLGKR